MTRPNPTRSTKTMRKRVGICAALISRTSHGWARALPRKPGYSERARITRPARKSARPARRNLQFSIQAHREKDGECNDECRGNRQKDGARKRARGYGEREKTGEAA